MGQMDDVSDIEQAVIAILAAVVVGSLFLFVTRPANNSDYSKENIKQKIKEHLHEKYGEEFVATNIGQRKSRDDVFYQAKIYPKSIKGTHKWFDEYYYASASVDVADNGELGGVGDSYSYVVRNIDVEKYLLPRTREIFGKRVLLKVDVEHQITGDGSWWAGYKSKSLEEMREAVENDPEHNRIMLDLDVYIFNQIEGEQEKEKRRKDIFEFVQYLKEEGLFEYLEMRVVFVDERVLAPSYDKFEDKIKSSHKVEVEIEEEDTTVELPPKELRKEMSEKLQEEVEEMSEKKLLDNMQKISKDELNHDGVGQWNGQYLSRIYSPKMIKERYTSTYEQDSNIIKHFREIDDVGLAPILDYIYVN